MPSILQRFGQLLSGAGDGLARLGAIVTGAGPRPTVPASVDLPHVSRWGLGSQANRDPELQRALGDVAAYLGRISYDAGPSMTRFSSYPATDLTPDKIIGAQQEAVAGYPLRWAEMTEQILSRDAHLMGIGQQRVDDVIKGSWRLIRSAPDLLGDCVRGFCAEGLGQVDDFEESLAWLLWGNAYGWNASEVIWKKVRLTFAGPDGKMLGPAEFVVPATLTPVHPKHFRFDLRTDEPLLWLGSDQISLPYGKFLFMKGEGQHPITERRGYMWQCAWLSMFKSIGIAGWSVFVERFGLPTPLLTYDGDVAQYNEHKSIYEQILRMLGLGWGAIVPSRNLKVDFAQVAQGGRANDAHSAFSDAMDAMQSIRVLGATLTAKIGNVGSFAASTSHMEVKYAREEADARRAWKSTVRPQLLAPMCVFNAEVLAAEVSRAYGIAVTPDMIVRRVPAGLHRVPRETDPVQRATVVDMAINKWGLKVKRSSLFDYFDLVEAASDDEAAPGAPQQVSSGGKVVGAIEAANEGAEAPQQPKNAPPTSSQRNDD